MAKMPKGRLLRRVFFLMSKASHQCVQEQAKLALASSPIYALRELCVEQNADALLISGRVDTYYHKQLAQEVVRAVADGCRVVNDIDVD